MSRFFGDVFHLRYGSQERVPMLWTIVVILVVNTSANYRLAEGCNRG